jgi:hypothetical protein
VQYASRNYTDLLKTRGITISMSRKGNPYDNAACESFMKTLKYEEVYRQEYRDLAEARFDRAFPGTSVQPETVALGTGLSTASRIRAAVAQARGRSVRMKPSLRFLRHGGIYRSDVVTKTRVTRGGAPPLVGRPPIPVKGRDGRNCAPCSSASSAMSSGRLFLDRGARQQCPSPLIVIPEIIFDVLLKCC